MKKTFLAAIGLALSLGLSAAHAQLASPTTNVNNSTNSSAQTSSSSGAMNAGNAQAITFNSEANDRLKTNPALGGNSFYGSFSGDSCMVSAGVGVSFVGFGGTGVTPIRDMNCDLRRSFERIEQAAAMQPKRADQLHQAANDVLCSLGGDVFQALNSQSLCSEWVVEKNGGTSAKGTQRSEVNFSNTTIRQDAENLFYSGA